MENAASDGGKFGDISCARVDGNPKSWASLSDTAEPSAPEKNIGGALVDEDTQAPKLRLSPAKMRTSTATGGLLYGGSASKAENHISPIAFSLELL